MTTASIWEPGSPVVNIDSESTNVSQVFVTTLSQTVFTLTTFSYTVGSHSIAVYRNGQRLILGVDFTESSSTTVTLLVAVEAGEYIEVVSVIGSASAASVAAVSAASAAAASASGAENSATDAAASLAALSQFTGAAVGGNLSFTGSGQRILGDFSNATVANRVMFQTSTVNDSSKVAALPNGSGTVSAFWTLNSSDPANTSFGYLLTSATETQIGASKLGTGSYLPMTFYTGGAERMRISTSGVISTPYSFQCGDDVTTGKYNIGSNGAYLTRYSADGSIGLVTAQANIIFATGASPSERMRIDTSGNVGIGVSPSAWSGLKSLDLGASGGFSAFGTTNVQMIYNSYFDGTNYRAKSTGAASYIQASASGLTVGTMASVSSGSVQTPVAQFQFDSSGNSLSVNSTGGLGYGTGSGGTVTQATSKSTAVTLNKPTGQITMNGAALAAGASVQFTLGNSLVTTSDSISLSILASSITNTADYRLCWSIAAGNVYIVLTNQSGASLSQAVQIQFVLHKGASA